MGISPKVSIVIPSYNHGRFVGRAIESALNQTFSDFEVLISDDCSTDNSAVVIGSFHDERMQCFFQEKNLGPVYAIRFLVKRARGEYIALLNSDDYWDTTKLEKQVAYMDAHPEIGACFTQGVMTDEKGRILNEMDVPYANVFIQPNRSQSEWLRYFWYYGNALAHMSILVRRHIYVDEICQNPALRQLPDFEIWERLVLRYPIHVLQESLVYHSRRTGENENTSAVSAVNSRRNLTEEAWIAYRTMVMMSNDQLIEGFSDDFIHQDVVGNDELDCERYFLLLKHRVGEEIYPYARMYFLDKSMSERFVKCMEEKYGYSLSRFFEFMGRERNESKRLGELEEAFQAERTKVEAERCRAEEKCRLQTEEISRLQAEKDRYMEMYNIISNSRIWRMTKPVRVVLDALKKSLRR